MRGLAGAAVALGLGLAAQGAEAADMPFLRGALFDGPRRHVNWEGFYVGGHAGYGTSDMNFTNATEGVVAKLLDNTVVESLLGVSSWPVLDKRSAHGHGYGGFVGYNAQWDSVVLGIEANYLHGNFGGATTGSMARELISGGINYGATNTSSASINVRDVGSARLRAGYAWKGFLPYMFGGVSLGQADIIRAATIRGRDAGGTWVLSAAQAQHGHFIYGYAGGVGIDMMLVGGLFLRAEWEYLKFAAPVDTSVSTVRAGLGYKF
uniref:Outer membrane protein beta-barrel domain-containing protein n=1 Tax=Rhodopseudomonas palustris (strain BisA53) TaxID=316055 RepID=Q07IZ4_RHOP5